VAFSPDGRRIASGMSTGIESPDWPEVKIRDPASGQETRTLRGHTARVFGVTFSPDGGRLASISWDGTVKLWEVATGGEVRTFRGMVQKPSEFGNAIAFRPDGRWLAATSYDGRVVVWEVETGRDVHALGGHSGPAYAVAFSPDGRRIATAAEDNIIKLWDAQTGEEVFTLRGHLLSVLGIAFSPDGNRIASASTDSTVKIWDAASRAPETFRHHRPLALIGPLFQRLLLKEDVIARLRSDLTFSPSLREAALTAAATWNEDAVGLNDASLEIVHSAGRSRTDFERALRFSKAACRQEPENGDFLNTLGVAQYRAEQYKKALFTLTRSIRRRI
jgi:WD40 repeat protein